MNLRGIERASYTTGRFIEVRRDDPDGGVGPNRADVVWITTPTVRPYRRHRAKPRDGMTTRAIIRSMMRPATKSEGTWFPQDKFNAKVRRRAANKRARRARRLARQRRAA